MTTTHGTEIPDVKTLQTLVAEHPEFIIDLAADPPDWDQIPMEHRELLRQGGQHLLGKEHLLRSLLDKILLFDDPGPSLEWLKNTGIMEHLLPELFATVNLSDESERRHKHVWDHTKQVVAQSPPDLIVRYAALFHDIGKVKTREFNETGKVTFYGHDIVGAGMFRAIARRLGLEKDKAKILYALIKYHLRPGQYEASWTDSAVRRMGKEVGEDLWERLLDLGRADITSKRPGKREAAIRHIDELQQRLFAIREEDSRVPPLPKGLGNLIMEKAGIPPGPRLGAIIRWLEAQVEAGAILPHQPGEYYVSLLHTYPLGKEPS
ncbi:HD domain-containing protein [Myxococcota bacterium]|nr:HD domain-containing protein [Myxococcota bacterium]MBU1537344.1 HD domain-containing protein [Myxococcota bacterium]